MKLFICMIAFGAVLAFAGETKDAKTPSIVTDEYDKTQNYFVKTFQDSKRSMETLNKAKEDAIERSKADAVFYQEGSEALNKYDVLLVLRNTDEKGEFEKRNQVAEEDVKNLNAIFEKYLNATLLPKVTSVRYARKMLSKAINQLEDMASEAKDPNESNNPELEIISLKMEDAKRKSERITEFAHRLGINIEREIASVETAVEEVPPPTKTPKATKKNGPQ